MKMENKLKVMEDSMIRANEQIKTLTDTINKAKIELQEKVVEINTKQK